MGGDDDYTDSRRELEPQSVDPKKGWGFRGVHRVFKYNMKRILHVLVFKLNLVLIDCFNFLGYNMRKSRTGSCAENFKEWSYSDCFYSWNWWHV